MTEKLTSLEEFKARCQEIDPTDEQIDRAVDEWIDSGMKKDIIQHVIDVVIIDQIREAHKASLQSPPSSAERDLETDEEFGLIQRSSLLFN